MVISFMAIKNKKYNIASDKVKPYLTESECLFYCVELQQAVFYTNKD
jgi:hypothetical protein